MTRILYGLIEIVLCSGLAARNPIVPPGKYLADPEAHVWKDGNLYIYGSRDVSDLFWCSTYYDMLFTSDMRSWNFVENIFSSDGKYDQVMHHDDLLYAPDCTQKDGYYYLYYCSPNKDATAGVAVSSSPFGPFIEGIHIKKVLEIDPAVLIDLDGQAYYYWGQGKPKVAKLKSNMKEIDLHTLTEPLDEAGNRAFHEGASIRRIGDLYYMVFADESRRNRPTCLGYAIGNSPMGPFEYKGIIIDNFGCDPEVWNNHGSIEQWKGQWYVFYHRSTHHSQKYRKACIEPIFINEDGTINEVEMTTQGASCPLMANQIIESEWACRLSGRVYVGTLDWFNEPIEGLTELSNGDVMEYRYLSFNNENYFELRGSFSSKGKLVITLDSLRGDNIGTCNLEHDAERTGFQTLQCQIKQVTGVHAVYLVFHCKDKVNAEIDWFRFCRQQTRH